MARLYLAADTSDVMAATDPRRTQNVRRHNTGFSNQPATLGEYPVEFLCREVLSKEHLLEALSFFLVRVPKRGAEGNGPESPAFTLFPRYHLRGGFALDRRGHGRDPVEGLKPEGRPSASPGPRQGPAARSRRTPAKGQRPRG
jgi:hypothetical protein